MDRWPWLTMLTLGAMLALAAVLEAASVNPCRYVYVTHNVSAAEAAPLAAASGADETRYDPATRTFTEVVYTPSAGCQGDSRNTRYNSRAQFTPVIPPLAPRSAGGTTSGGNTSSSSRTSGNCPGTTAANQPKTGTPTTQTAQGCQNR